MGEFYKKFFSLEGNRSEAEFVNTDLLFNGEPSAGRRKGEKNLKKRTRDFSASPKR